MKKLLFTIALTAFAFTAFAQNFERYDDSQGTYERTTKRGPYLTGKFFDNWFVGVAGGVNIYMSSGDSHNSLGKRMAPALDVNLGKWITPSVGVRMQYSGLKVKGASNEITVFTETERNSNGHYNKKFNYFNIHGDFLWNMSNAIGGYKETRTWDLIPFVGFGFAKASKNGNRSRELAGTVGLINNFRLGGVVDLDLEIKHMMTKARFDKYTARGTVDGNLSITAGLTFKLGPKGGFKRPMAAAPADYTPYQKRINALQDDLTDANSRISKLQKDLDDCNKRPTPKPEVVTAPVSMSIFFKIGKSNISEMDMKNIESFATTIKSTGKTYIVTGYADAGTGSVKLNEELSRKRAEAVADALVKYGVNRSQLKVEGKGGVTNHSNPALDRVAIVAE